MQVWLHILISLYTWHVRHSWTKQLIAKMSNPFAKAQINQDLGDMMYSEVRGLYFLIPFLSPSHHDSHFHSFEGVLFLGLSLEQWKVYIFKSLVISSIWNCRCVGSL